MTSETERVGPGWVRTPLLSPRRASSRNMWTDTHELNSRNPSCRPWLAPPRHSAAPGRRGACQDGEAFAVRPQGSRRHRAGGAAPEMPRKGRNRNVPGLRTPGQLDRRQRFEAAAFCSNLCETSSSDACEAGGIGTLGVLTQVGAIFIRFGANSTQFGRFRKHVMQTSAAGMLNDR